MCKVCPTNSSSSAISGLITLYVSKVRISGKPFPVGHGRVSYRGLQSALKSSRVLQSVSRSSRVPQRALPEGSECPTQVWITQSKMVSSMSKKERTKVILVCSCWKLGTRIYNLLDLDSRRSCYTSPPPNT